MPKTLSIHDLLKSAKKRPYPPRPKRAQAEVLPPEMVSLQIEVPYKVFEHFKGDGRGWKGRMARALERAAQND